MALKIIVTFCIVCFMFTGTFAAETREPKQGLKWALTAAETYVVSKNLNTSTLFLERIYRREFPKNSKRNCWVIIWAPKNPHILDGELRVYIYDNGQIEHGGAA